MKNIKYLILLFLINISVSMAAKVAEPYPLEYFAKRFSINNVEISPDGKQLALLRISTTEGNPVLEIYQTKDLSIKPFRMDADPMEITGYGWISNKDIIVTLRQKVRDKIDGFNQGAYETRLAKLNLRTKKIKQFDSVGDRIVSSLRSKPNKVILGRSVDLKISSKSSNSFRPTNYYELNLKTGAKKLMIKAKISLSNIIFDSEGNPRIGFGRDLSEKESVYYYRAVGSKKWKEIYRLHEDSFESFNIQGIDHTKPDTLFVVAHNGEDKTSLWEFDVKNNKFGEKIYGRSDVDITGVVDHSDVWNKPDQVVGLTYSTDKRKREFFDAEEAGLYKQLETIIPNAHNLTISSRAKDNNSMVVTNSGPRDPGTYYLVKDNKLAVIGSRNPRIKPENLADVKYLKYKARDGKIIRAFATIPNGEGPFPTIVMPHGGPFVSEVVSYDEWGQMLANNGYLVLQPQYRGSRGFGLDFYQAAFINGGEGGGAMQDDKDDGVKYLIKKGLADPDRVAMFGWSYGGYAALIAAAREDQLYQCVIAGAAVSDNNLQINYYKTRLSGSGEVEQINMWQDSISPIEEVQKVNVPILLVHGSIDQRVPPEHAERYREELKKHNKNFEYLELDGADHFSNTLFYNHKIKLYEAMTDYLKNKCGPEGL
ncbi:MAG: alpha/beta hydrolase family protein [Marinicellaceae bacterium]